MTTALGQGWNVLASAAATSYQLLKMALWRTLLGGNFTSLFSWSLPHFYFSLLASFFFLSQSDYYLAAGQAQITWLDPFFPLALPCSGLSTSVPWLCSWSIISRVWPMGWLTDGLLFGLFLREGSWKCDEFVSDRPLTLYSCVTQSSLHFCTCLMWRK